MDKNFAIAQLTNCTVIICFTVLAILFKHWWIALFTIFFFVTSVKTTKGGKDG